MQCCQILTHILPRGFSPSPRTSLPIIVVKLKLKGIISLQLSYAFIIWAGCSALACFGCWLNPLLIIIFRSVVCLKLRSSKEWEAIFLQLVPVDNLIIWCSFHNFIASVFIISSSAFIISSDLFDAAAVKAVGGRRRLCCGSFPDTPLSNAIKLKFTLFSEETLNKLILSN